MHSTHSIDTSMKMFSDKIKSTLAIITKVEGWEFKKNTAYILTNTANAESAFRQIVLKAGGIPKTKTSESNKITRQTLITRGLLCERGQDSSGNKMITVKLVANGDAQLLSTTLDNIIANPTMAEDRKSDSSESDLIDNVIKLHFYVNQTSDEEDLFIEEPHSKKSLLTKLAECPEIWNVPTTNNKFIFIPTRLIKAALQEDDAAVSDKKKKSKKSRVVVINQRFPLYPSREEFLYLLEDKLNFLAGGVKYGWQGVLDENQKIISRSLMNEKAYVTFKQTCKKHGIEVINPDQTPNPVLGYEAAIKLFDVYEKIILRGIILPSTVTAHSWNLGGDRVQTAGDAKRENPVSSGNSPSTTTLASASSMGVRH